MLFGNRRPQKSDARRRLPGNYRPLGDWLEHRLLLSIDLGGTSPPANPLIATAPFGMAFGASTTAGGVLGASGAGWSVSDVGDVTGSGYDDFVVGAPTMSSPGLIGTGLGSAAYLIFGSATVGVSSVTDWIGKTASGTFQYTANDRVGDLSQLGAATQTNPVSGATLGFPRTSPRALGPRSRRSRWATASTAS
jgi:hypothetical protein